MLKDKISGGSRTKAQTIMGVSLSALFLLILLFNFIFAQPIYRIEADVDKGFTIVDFPQAILKQNEDYTHSFFVYNKTTGNLMDNSSVSCLFYVTNSNGDLVYNKSSTYTSEGYWVNTIPKETFVNLGLYYYGIKCQQGTFGGAMASVWEITPSGSSGTENTIFYILIIALIYGITFISFFYGKNIPMTILGGMAMIFLGVYTINNGIIIFRDTLTNYISYLTIGIGFILSSWALLEQFDAI